MKKIILILTALALCLCFTACKNDTSGDEPIRIAALKGPTSIGLLDMLSNEQNSYDYTLAGTADEINAPFIKGEYDMIAVPCNVASVLYNKTEGNVQVLAVNTLGVLYVVDTDGSVTDIESLRGKTVYSTGKGTTPEFVLNHILSENGLTVGTDVFVEFVSEATELAGHLANKTATVAVLPQPYVTTVLMQNKDARIALSLTEEWDKISDTEMITGVVIAKKDFVENNKAKVEKFLESYKASIATVSENVEKTADACVAYGIIPKKEVAIRAIPYCNVEFIGGEDMKAAVSAYLGVLHSSDPKSVGGALPADGFYYLGK